MSWLKGMIVGAVCGSLVSVLFIVAACGTCPDDLTESSLFDDTPYPLTSTYHRVNDENYDPLLEDENNPLRPVGVVPVMSIDREADVVTFSYEVDGNPVVETWQVTSHEEGVTF